MRPIHAIRTDGVRPVFNDALNRIERRMGHSRMWSGPVEVTIEPTNECNGRCVMCLPYRTDASLPAPASGYLEWETLHALEPALSRARAVLFTGFGEPLMHPEYPKMARWLKERVPYVSMFTNGALLNAAIASELVDMGFDEVSFSVGGSTDQTQQYIRGVGLGALHGGIEALVAEKRRRGSDLPRIQFNIVAMNSLLPEVLEIIDYAAEQGVEAIEMPTLWVESAATEGESVFENPDAAAVAREAKERAATKGIRLDTWRQDPAPSPCTGPWKGLVTAFDGTVFSCQFERYDLGNVHERPVLDIWRGAAFARLRRETASSPESVCPACPLICGTEEVYSNPALHGRLVMPRFTEDGPERIEHRRVLD